MTLIDWKCLGAENDRVIESKGQDLDKNVSVPLTKSQPEKIDIVSLIAFQW